MLFSTVPHTSFVVTEETGLTGDRSRDFFSGFDPNLDFYSLLVALILLNPSLSVHLCEFRSSSFVLCHKYLCQSSVIIHGSKCRSFNLIIAVT